ncbi:MAG: hypothetical protein H6821_12360 [Planctomycetaceae bacterium]|nr:hypothetical protein [Planctomycetales bacterium]MCB9874961.1 hypothetical protein [Planctomycetaceae bacterium]MCB9939384.1 hypothetical protein [Planctomycetaceae bacterium]
MSWMLLWKVVLLVTIGCFSIMTIVVTIGGALDIRRLFERLKEDRDEEA